MHGSHACRLATFVLTVAVTALPTGPAFALPQDPDEQKAGGAGPTALEQAREESGVEDRPRTRFELPSGVLRLAASELLAAAQQELELSVTLDRDVSAGTLELTLPRQWIGRSGVSDLPYARVPARGRGSSRRAGARRSGRVVTLAFAGARAGDEASFALRDAGIPAGSYRLPYRWRERGGASARGSATVVFYAPTREEAEGAEAPDWTYLIRDTNVTSDLSTESETFVSVVPGNSQRYLVGVNGGGGYNAWITNTGGASFTKAPMSASIDAPAEGPNETGDLCCDPMSAADAAGNLWYGGLSFSNGLGNPSRIVVARAAPAALTLGSTVGLRERTGTGTQDKPMMTIDNSPTSPTFGRLYVVWDEPAGGINIVMSQCDTRPGGVLNAANCDNADNWTAPISVTPSTGSYIYADVAVGPDGKVYVVWWDYSATNAIRGDVCNPVSQNCASAAGWGTPQTIATLDATGGPLPFACPILAQPGGRASTSPQVDVDRSGGPNHGRVYVTWSDLKTGSGSTRCADGPTATPLVTHLTFDSFVASAAGLLPGSANPSPSVATRLLTDGEAGGQANSDDWFAWLAVDQTNGRAWADLYSTRDDATRKTTNFYARSVTPNGSGHLLGPLRKVSTAPSDYSAITVADPCCDFRNDYGDYTGIDATQGVALPVWSDKRGGLDGEAFVDTVLSPFLVPAAQALDDSAAAGGDGDGVLETGESFRLAKQLTNTGTAAATGVSSALIAPAGITLTQASSAYPDIAIGTTQANATLFAGTMAAGAPCGSPVTMTLQVLTATEPALVPVTIPTACSAVAPPPPAPPLPPPPPPPPPAPPPPPPPPLPPLTFRLAGASTQKPLKKSVGLVVTLSCPQENCTVSVKGTVTVPAAKTGGTAKKVSLKSSSVNLTKGKTAKLTFKLSKKLRSQVSSALKRARTRTKVKALISATATGAGNRKATKTLTIKVRR